MKRYLIPLLLAISSPALADLSGFPKWNRVVEQEKTARQAHTFRGDIKPVLDALQARYRAVPYVEDWQNWGKEDYWATRAEMKAKGSGDCEDFAIAEYFDLLEKGVSDNDMEILVVLTRKDQSLHAVLRVQDWVLDRRAERVMTGAEFDRFYQPFFGINRLGWSNYLNHKQ